MQAFLWNIFLALVWSASAGELSLLNLVVGFLLGYLVLRFLGPAFGFSPYFDKLHGIIGFLFYFAWELIRANLRVAYDDVTPSSHMHPGVVAVPLDAETDLEITILASLISLTPGTLTLDITSDRKFLYVHGMFVTDRDSFCREIKDGMERRLLRILR